MIVNLTGETVRLYGPDSPEILNDPMSGLGAVIPADQPAADLRVLHLGSIGDQEYRGHTVPLDLAEIHIDGLPEARPDCLYVVTSAVALASRGRSDLLVPLGEVHDPEGALLGHRTLISPC